MSIVHCVQAWYAKAWGVFAAFMAIPIYYHYSQVDEFRQPFVSVAQEAVVEATGGGVLTLLQTIGSLGGSNACSKCKTQTCHATRLSYQCKAARSIVGCVCVFTSPPVIAILV